MDCLRCGSGLPERAAFCPSCGAPVPAAATLPASAGARSLPDAAGVETRPAQPLPAPATQAYGGFWRRFGGHVLDRFILGVTFTPVGVLLLMPLMAANSIGWSDTDLLEQAFGALLGAVVTLTLLAALGGWLYYALLQSSPRQATLGQMVLGIRITDLEGRRVSFARASGRYFASLLTNLTFGIGYLIQLFTARRQALHDLIAGTLVLR
jgi:uncharacterized RDD family membrane protein YckC